MRKHTPGPWFAADWRNDFGEDLFTIEARSPEVLGQGMSSIWPDGIQKHHVASVEESGFDRETTLSNARLIAAAPELLEALKAALELLEREFPNPAPNGQIVKARAAIAKAEGRA